jgi:hypothetical protein
LNPPQAVKTAAIIQLISGVVTLFIAMPLAWFAVASAATLFTVVTFGFGALCGFCTWGTCLLIPVGFAEIVIGIIGLSNPAAAAPLQRPLAYVELVGLLFGGFTCAIAGGIVLSQLSNPEVEMWRAQLPRN